MSASCSGDRVGTMVFDDRLRALVPAQRGAQALQAIRTALEATPPELSGDIADRGLVLTGGVAMLRNLDERIAKEVGVPVSIAESPLSSVVLGISKMLGDFKTLRRITLN